VYLTLEPEWGRGAFTVRTGVQVGWLVSGRVTGSWRTWSMYPPSEGGVRENGTIDASAAHLVVAPEVHLGPTGNAVVRLGSMGGVLVGGRVTDVGRVSGPNNVETQIRSVRPADFRGRQLGHGFLVARRTGSARRGHRSQGGAVSPRGAPALQPMVGQVRASEV